MVYPAVVSVTSKLISGLKSLAQAKPGMATFFSKTSIGSQADKNSRKKKVYNILDNRPPLNFFKGNIFTKINLQNIQYLFLCFFQLIFHEHHAFLYAGVIGLGARGIYLAANFL